MGYFHESSSNQIQDALQKEDTEQAKRAGVIKTLAYRAYNNARRRAELKHNFLACETTLKGVVPIDDSGLSYSHLYMIPDITGSLVVSGSSTAAVLTDSSGLLGSRYDGFPLGMALDGTHIFVKSTATAQEFTAQSLELQEEEKLDIFNSRQVWSLKNGGTIPDGTYTVYYNIVKNALKDFTSGAEHRYVTMKVPFQAWIHNTVDNVDTPVNLTTKRNLARMLHRRDTNSTPDNFIQEISTLFQQGKRFYLYPTSDTEAVTVKIDCNIFLDDYVLPEQTDFFLQEGFEYMQWASCVELNRLLKIFLPNEANSLPPPIRERNEAFEALVGADKEARILADID